MTDNTFDYIDYIVMYGCKYNTGHTFLKDAFKTDYEQIVPIVHNRDHNLYLGDATLEHREDGVVAKCRFNICGQLAKELLETGRCDLSFMVVPVERDCELVTSGTIRAVLFLDKKDKPSIMSAYAETVEEA